MEAEVLGTVLLPLALVVLWRLRTLGTRQAIQALCTPCGEKALCANLFPSDPRNQNVSNFNLPPPPFFFYLFFSMPSLPFPVQTSPGLPPMTAFPLPRAASHQTHMWSFPEMLPQSSAAQLGLTFPASPGQEEGSWSSPWLLDSGRCFLPLRSP